MVTWREAIPTIPLLLTNGSQALTAAGWGATHATLASLRTHASYEVQVSAFNAVGAGPPCTPITASTLEGRELLQLIKLIFRTLLLGTLTTRGIYYVILNSYVILV